MVSFHWLYPAVAASFAQISPKRPSDIVSQKTLVTVPLLHQESPVHPLPTVPPAAAEQVMEYVEVVVVEMTTEPDVAPPVANPLPAQSTAFVEDHESVELCPLVTVEGENESVAVGAESETGTVTLCETEGGGVDTIQVYISVFTAEHTPEFTLQFLSGGLVHGPEVAEQVGISGYGRFGSVHGQERSVVSLLRYCQVPVPVPGAPVQVRV